MKYEREQKLKGVVEPLLGRQLSLVRICAAFVDNLAMILRVAFVAGAVFLVGELGELADRLGGHAGHDAGERGVADAPPRPATVLPATSPQPQTLSERTRHYLNCTYEAYRSEHYAECVEEPSVVYPPIEAGPDDRGRLLPDVRPAVSTAFAAAGGFVPPSVMASLDQGTRAR